MNATSLNNLWTYLQGVLTVDDQRWLGDKLLNASSHEVKDTSATTKQKFRFSQRRKDLMKNVVIDPRDFENDERAQYILRK